MEPLPLPDFTHIGIYRSEDGQVTRRVSGCPLGDPIFHFWSGRQQGEHVVDVFEIDAFRLGGQIAAPKPHKSEAAA
jgi:hypothetical protein